MFTSIRMPGCNLTKIADYLSKSFQYMNYKVFRLAVLLRVCPGNAIIVRKFFT